MLKFISDSGLDLYRQRNAWPFSDLYDWKLMQLAELKKM
jgi:hypothetical protein